MKNMTNSINRNNLDSLLVNESQNKVNNQMQEFASKIPSINDLRDLKFLDEQFFSYFSLDKDTPKFKCTSIEIFERRSYSGCSDIGLAIAPILRLKGVPTIYVESANVDWIKDVQEDNEDKELMQGHIFLEIYLNGTWYLYDPTFHLVYCDYDYDNVFLPRGYVAFAKGLNCHELGIYSVQDEKRVSITQIEDFAIDKYKEPNYEPIDIRRITPKKTI